MTYGPKFPGPIPVITDNRIVEKPGRYARKIRSDLERVSRIYDGIQIRLFKLRDDSERCTECTNLLTGECMISNCPTCGGTGYALAYTQEGDFWTRIDFTPRVIRPSEQGNTDNPGIQDQMVVIGAPILKARDIMITIISKEVFKILDREPQVVASGGEVISQIAFVSRITPGGSEYKLIDW